MYTVKLYNNTGSSAEALLADCTVRSWSNRLNGPGRFAFTLPLGSTNLGLLRPYRQVTLERRKQDGTDADEGAWIGFVESFKRTSRQEYTVFCAGLLQEFRKIPTAKDETFTGQGSTEAFELLTAANAIRATGVTAGTGGVTTTKSLKAQGYADVLSMWEDMAMAHGAEFDITFARQFRYVPSLGSDKSGTVTLRFRRDGEPGNTVEDLEEGEDGEPMANRIIASTTGGGGLSYTWDDATSQSTYGVLVEVKEFNEAQDAGTLQSLAGAYGAQRANPITDFQARPVMAEKRLNALTGALETVGLQYGDVVPGDLVTCDFVTEGTTLQAVRRVAEVLVDVDEEDNEVVRYTLSKTGIYVSSNYLEYDKVGELTRRIQAAERLL